MAATAPPAGASGAPPEDKQWFALAADAVAGELGVDTHAGLAPPEAASPATGSIASAPTWGPPSILVTIRSDHGS